MYLESNSSFQRYENLNHCIKQSASIVVKSFSIDLIRCSNLERAHR